MFERLNRQNRYAILYRIATAKCAQMRARRIQQFVSMLKRGETSPPTADVQLAPGRLALIIRTAVPAVNDTVCATRVMGRTGIEPVTLGLKVPCSTN